MKSRQFIFKKSVFKIFVSNTAHISFKAIAQNQHLEQFYRYFSFYIYVSKHYSAFHTKLKPVCLMTGRSRGLLNAFHLSRIVFKEYSISGTFFGFKKSQWLNRLTNLRRCLILVYFNQNVEFRLRILLLIEVFSTFFSIGDTYLITIS
jgi:ribosomal protein S14